MVIKVFKGNHPSLRSLFSYGFRGEIIHSIEHWLLCDDQNCILGGVVFYTDSCFVIVPNRTLKYENFLVGVIREKNPRLRIDFPI